MSFNDVIGQKRPKEILRRALRSDRLAHAILLHGPEGVGKRAMAFELAKAVNCTNSAADPCDTCSSCRKISSLQHPDLKVLFPAPAQAKVEEELSVLRQLARDRYKAAGLGRSVSISIEKVRELQRDAAYRPYEGKRKVAVILEADQMRAEAANALLKTLEEPPDYLLLILTTAKPNSLLPTILSRCQLLRLERLSAEEVEKALMDREKIALERAKIISRLSDGNLRRALQMVEEDLDEYRDVAWDLLQTALWGQDLEALDLVDSITRQQEKVLIERLLEIALLWLRDSLLWGQGREDEVTNFDRPQEIQRLSDRFDAARVEQSVQKVESCLEMMSRNVNIQLILIWLMGQLRKEV